MSPVGHKMSFVHAWDTINTQGVQTIGVRFILLYFVVIFFLSVILQFRCFFFKIMTILIFRMRKLLCYDFRTPMESTEKQFGEQ